MKTTTKICGLFVVVAVALPSLTLAQGFQRLNTNTPTTQSGPTSVTLTPPTTKLPKGADAIKCSDPDVQVPDGLICWNATDVDLSDMILQVSAVTGKNFILEKNVRGKITIISENPMTIDMFYEAFLSALAINNKTTVMTPSGLLKIIDTKDVKTEPKDIFKSDVSPEATNTDQYITRIIQLTNISANEIAQIIKPMVSKTGEAIPYPTTNSLIITEMGSHINHILKIIKELDQEGPQEVLDIIPILHADAKSIADKVTEIFDKEDNSSNTRSRRRRRSRRNQPDLEDVQSISKVIADERTNSILIMGTKRSIIKVRALIAQLDRSMEGAQGRIHVYYLKYAKSKDVSTVLSSLVQDAKTKSSSTNARGARGKAAATTDSSSVTLEGGVKVTADEATNSLIVVASPKDFSTLVDNVIKKLDVRRPQVYLEAVIMSLDVQKTQTVGVSGFGGLINTLAGGNRLNSFAGILPSSSSAISTIAGASGGFGGGVVSSDTIDFTLSDGSSVSIPAVSGIIMALASDTNANVLSTPSIMTLDNEEATIQVGQEVPVPSGTTVSAGVTTFDVSREDTGIILKITPQISENDTVRLQISQEITSVFTSDPNLGPTLDKKSVETVVLANNKQTIVIGGLIDDKATVSTQKVPLLGDIPVLGSLFRTRQTTKEKSNLIVFITPYIVRERKDYMAILKKRLEERNKFIDMNYGKSQRKLIRKAIEDHAEDLLEFKCDIPRDGNPCGDPVPSVVSYQPSQKTTQTTVSTQPSAPAPKTEVKQQPTQTQTTSTAQTKKPTSISTDPFGPKQKVKYKR